MKCQDRKLSFHLCQWFSGQPQLINLFTSLSWSLSIPFSFFFLFGRIKVFCVWLFCRNEGQISQKVFCCCCLWKVSSFTNAYTKFLAGLLDIHRVNTFLLVDTWISCACYRNRQIGKNQYGLSLASDTSSQHG